MSTRERPILMSAPMVRALLDGTKTQTRRICKVPMRAGMPEPELASLLATCRYGKPGDRLWVRETSKAIELPSGLDGVRYSADQAFRPIENTREASEAWMAMHAYRRGRGLVVPAIHMPRWASRIALELTGVRVERVQDISIADAMAEGVVECNESLRGLEPCMEWRYAYEDLWNSINGPGAWDSNPWVWVVGFRRIDADQP